MIDGFHNMVSRTHLYSSDDGEQEDVSRPVGSVWHVA